MSQRRRYGYGRRKNGGMWRIIVLGAAAAVVLYGAGWLVFQVNQGWQDAAVEASPVDRLAEAERNLQERSFQDARDMLEPLLAADAPQATAARALLLAARVEEQAGDSAAQRRHLERLVGGYAATAEWPHGALKLARLQAAAGEGDAAKVLFKKVAETAPPELRAEAQLGLGEAAAAVPGAEGAHDLMLAALGDAEWQSPAWQAALDRVGEQNVKAIFSAEPTPESRIYNVEPGDNLTAIGIKLNTTQGLLMTANGITDPASLKVGQPLKYTPKDFRIIIDRSACALYLLDDKGIFKRYKVGLGKEGHETALGRYTIGNKQKDPVWHKPGAGAIAAGDPANELGTRWMPLVPVEQGLPTDLGIHGTIAPETIGSFSSSGCARMLPADVEELYDLVVRSTPVEIVEKFTPEMQKS